MLVSFSYVCLVLEILAPVGFAGRPGFTPGSTEAKKGVFDSVLHKVGVTTRVKRPCDPPPRGVCTDVALSFSF